MVETSGSACDRVLLETASARSFPSLTSGTAGAIEPKEIGVWPATTEAIAGPPPLNGTCTRSSPSDRRNCSPARCDCVPAPADAKLYLPGLARTSATTSLTVCAGTDGLTTNTVVEVVASVTGSKSL